MHGRVAADALKSVAFVKRVLKASREQARLKSACQWVQAALSTAESSFNAATVRMTL